MSLLVLANISLLSTVEENSGTNSFIFSMIILAFLSVIEINPLFIKNDNLGIILSNLLIIISAWVSEIEASPPWRFNELPSLNQLLISERLIGLSNLCTQRNTALLVCKSGKIK